MQNFKLAFGFIMIALYAAAGILFLSTDFLIKTVSHYRTPLGTVFIIYAGFRTVLTILQFRKVTNSATSE